MPPSPRDPPSHLEGEGVGLLLLAVEPSAKPERMTWFFDPVGIPSMSTAQDIPGIHSVLVFGLEWREKNLAI